MPKPPFHNFHTRIPQDIKEALDASRGRKSLNREIVDRLRLTIEGDEASQIAQALRPFLASLDKSDRTELVELASRMLDLLAKGKGKPRRQKS